MLMLILFLLCNCICCYDFINISYWIFDFNKYENINVCDGVLK